MLQIPAPIVHQFTNYITQQGIPSGQHGHYLKWARYYLDFCHKYHFRQGADPILPAFLKKLEKKKQKLHLRELAVRLLLSCTQSSELQLDFSSNDKKFHVSKILPNTNLDNRQENKVLESFPRQTETPHAAVNAIKIKGADWTRAFAE